MNLLDLLKKKQAPAPMAYNPGTMRQFTPGPMPDVPFMPAPMIGAQQIPTGYAPQGGLGGLGGMPMQQMQPQGPGGPMIQPPAPGGMGGPNIMPPPPGMPGPGDVSAALKGLPPGAKSPTGGFMGMFKGFDPQRLQGLLAMMQQRQQRAPIQFQQMPMNRGGQ